MLQVIRVCCVFPLNAVNQAQRRSCSQWLQHESLLYNTFWMSMASATSTVNMWGLGYSMLARKQSWTFARFELLGKNLKGHHHCIDAPGFNSLDVVPGEGVPCLFDVSQSRFQGHWVKTAWHKHFCCSEANNQTEGLQQLDGLGKINSSELKVLRSFIQKKIREKITRLSEKLRQLSDQHG